MFTIDNIMSLFVDSNKQFIELFDLEINETIYTGLYEDMEEIFGGLPVVSIDNLNNNDILVLNI